MVIRLDENYNAMTSTALLGYVGETNARPVSVEGMEIDGADRYVLTIDYGDGVQYEVDITGGTWTPTADILRSAQTVSCQICAKKLSGQEYILLKKSRIFRLRIGAAIGDTAIPSPSVAADALDRIDAIGRQAHADMQTAVTAAETATTAAENAEKSAITAGLSADTAEQAANRAETAKAAAETSATQADTARQGAETARQQAVKSQNDAKVSAAQASTAAQQTEADKNITAGYAKTAKTCADSTATDRQAVQTLAEQVTADKANVAENTAKVAEDRVAAETAAQTAQAVADSLPDDYVTAVGKIAENTAEIGRVKLTDKELQRRVNALYDMGNGVTHKFETDSETAYAKTVPTGGKLMSVKSVGGRSIVFNQLVDFSNSKEITTKGVKFTLSGDGIVTLNGACTEEGQAIAVAVLTNVKGHKYLLRANPLSGVYGVKQLLFSSQGYGDDQTGRGVIITNGSSNAKWYYTLYLYNGVTYDNVKLQPQIFNLTAMFGSGNEPASVEEFEAMFPNDYYQYNAGEIVSAGTESVVEQGKNLFNKSGKENSDAYTIPMYYNGRYKGLKIPCENGDYTVSTKHKSGYVSGMSKSVYVFDSEIRTDNNITGLIIEHLTGYGYNVDKTGIISVKHGYIILSVFSGESTGTDRKSFFDLCDIQIEKSPTATAYTPYHSNVYQIPEAIKALPGYGWSAGTAKNYVDYENKRYVQCVNSVDLGTLDWKFNTTSAVGNHFYAPAVHLNFKYLGAFGTTIYNALCSKYRTVARSSNVFVDKTLAIDGVTVVSQIQVKDTAYTDTTAFKQAMQGVILYYELEKPIVTDISTLIPDDFLRNIEVEAGGSVTFKNSNDNYHIPVPNEEEYIVKLSEVGGTT